MGSILRLNFFFTCVVALSTSAVRGQQSVTFSLPGLPTRIQADLYGSGDRAIMLAHGGRFNKESWKKQAEVLASNGFLVLAIRFRGDYQNPDGSSGSSGSNADNAADVLAALSYLHQRGAKTISAVGASLGGDAIGEADAGSAPGAITRMVFLGSSGGDSPEKLTGKKLFIVARDDKSSYGLRLPEISRHYKKTPQPKSLVILKGSAHAQFLFATGEGPDLLRRIVDFLSRP